MFVQKARCNQCLFSKAKIVSAARKKEIIQACLDKDTHFVCHKAQLLAMETGQENQTPDLVCAGFLQAHPGVGKLVRMAKHFGWIKEVEV